MSRISLNGNDLMRLRLRLPLYGAWVAECLHGDPSLVPDVGASANIYLESQTFLGTVVRTSYLQDLGWDSLVVGGAGGLSSLLPPAQFVSLAPSLALQDALRAAGEVQASSIDSTLLAGSWGSWRRPSRTLGRELDALSQALSKDSGQDIRWRVLSDGTIWLGEPVWEASSVQDYDAMSGDAAQGCHVIAAEDPTVLPGQTWVTGERIGEVVHQINPRASRTEIWVTDASDRDAGAFDDLLPPVDLLSVHQYRVISQNADKTLELRTTDTRLPDLSKVPMRFGLPGASADIPSGHVVLVAFAGGDERDPCAVSWVSGTATNLRLEVGTLLELGSSPATSFAALSSLVDARFAALSQAFTTWVPVPADGGAALKALITALQGTGWPQSVAATKVKVT